MDVTWKSWSIFLTMCLLQCAHKVVSQRFWLEPLNATALRGSDAQFNATVEGTWQVMTWHIKEFLVLTVSGVGNVTTSSEQYSARFCIPGENNCVQFNIHNVTRELSGPVTCIVQGEFGSKTAQLSVQEMGMVNIVKGNENATEDEQVEFHCVATAWSPAPSITWTLDGHPADSSLVNSSSVADGDYFNATSVLTFTAVRNTTVACQAAVSSLTIPVSHSVFLVVFPKPPDWTVLIAVVLSFSLFALLILLILGILFCYKRRKEKQPNYHEEMTRRVRTQSQISSVSASVPRQGNGNAGFALEDQTSVTPSENTVDFIRQTGTITRCLMLSTVTTGNHYNRANIPVGEVGMRKHRHVTLV